MSKTKKNKMYKKMKSRNSSKSQKCDKEYTYSSIVSGYNSILDGISNAIINKSKHLNNRVKIYKDDVYREYDCMLKLHKKIKDADKKEDLRIMLDRLKIIIKYVENGIKL